MLTATGSLVGVALAVACHVVAWRNTPLTAAEASVQTEADMVAFSHLQIERIRVAAEGFARDRKAQGLRIPAAVSFKDLAAHGNLSSAEVAPFSNAETSVFLKAAEAPPGTTWIRVTRKDRTEISIPYVNRESQ